MPTADNDGVRGEAEHPGGLRPCRRQSLSPPAGAAGVPARGGRAAPRMILTDPLPRHRLPRHLGPGAALPRLQTLLVRRWACNSKSLQDFDTRTVTIVYIDSRCLLLKMYYHYYYCNYFAQVHQLIALLGYII
jgi:hypothetical protein